MHSLYWLFFRSLACRPSIGLRWRVWAWISRRISAAKHRARGNKF
jgi:hypothetical protein